MSSLPNASQPTHVVAIVGGAVAGSEAAALCAERGVLAIVFEQNDRPYGKIEDGLPRWHVALRNKEYGRIDANLEKDGVLFVPRTRLGEDIPFEDLTGGLGLSAVILANGAWRDRALPVEGAEAFVGKGLVYQNPFVYWFNHYHEAGYAGPTFESPDGTVVVGGGLASIDVVKILALEAYARALKERGHDADMVALEHRGVPHYCDKHGIDIDELGVKGPILLYRRRKQDMPLAAIPPGTGDDRKAKILSARERIMDKVIRNFGVRLEECRMPVGFLTEGDRLVGLRVRKTEIVDGRVKPIDGSDYDLPAPMVVSSIGSIPEPISGVPTKGELFHYRSWDTGELEGHTGVYGLGNVLTGKGNIKDSRKNALQVMGQVIEGYLGVQDGEREAEAAYDEAHAQAREGAAAAVDAAVNGPPLSPEAVAKVLETVKARWSAAGYGGDYADWMKKVGRSE